LFIATAGLLPRGTFAAASPRQLSRFPQPHSSTGKNTADQALQPCLLQREGGCDVALALSLS
jgi:hypothetical protein